MINEVMSFVDQYRDENLSSDIELKYGKYMNEREIIKYEIDESFTDEDAQDWGYQDLEDFWHCNDPD